MCSQKFIQLLHQLLNIIYYCQMQPLKRSFGRQITNIPLIIKNKNTASITYSHSQYAEHPYPHSKTQLAISQPNNSLQPHKTPFDKQKWSPAIIKTDSMTDYYNESIQFMLLQQAKYYSQAQYSKLNETQAQWRAVLLDWIIDVHLKFKMFPQTLFIVATIIDRYLTIKTFRKQDFQLVGATALFIAAKYEQTYEVPTVSKLVSLCAKSFSKSDLLRTESEIIKTLNFELIFNTAYHFLSPFSQLLDYQPKKLFLAQYVLQLALLDAKFIHFKPSLLASSAIFLVNKIKKTQNSWPDIIKNISGYEESQLRPCARELCQLLQSVDSLKHIQNLRAKFCNSKFEEVGKIRLQKKNNNRK